MSVILGLDPGSLKLGYGVIEVSGNRLSHRTHGTIATSSRQALPQRLASLYRELVALVEEHRPDAVALERVFTARNPKSALTLGQARGMILLLVGQYELDLAEYTPGEVKLAVGGHGRSSKGQVAAMVEHLLRVRLDGAGPDSTDALAIAVCHGHGLDRRRMMSRIVKSQRG